MDELLHQARVSRDPAFAHRCLVAAQAQAPDSLEVRRALLMLGRLHERDGRNADYSLIKCHLLHSFEHPEQYPQEQLRAKARELFEHPDLTACLALAPDPAEFLRGYLLEMSREYMRIFVAGDNSHIPRVFGISLKGSLQKYLAVPARDILSNILSSPHLEEDEALALARAFYRAYFEYAQGDILALDSLLGAGICARLGRVDK